MSQNEKLHKKAPNESGAIEQTLSEFDFFEPIGLCFKYILIFLVGIC